MQERNEADVQLIARFKAGDEAAFLELMSHYKNPVLNFIFRMTGQAEEAEDVAQDVFVRVYQNLAGFQPGRGASVSTWIFQIARRAAIDRLRYLKHRRHESLENAPEPATGKTPHDEAHTREVSAAVAAAVAALPEDQRTALVLAEYEGLAQAEIAAIMKSSIKSVEARIYRARQALKETLAAWL